MGIWALAGFVGSVTGPLTGGLLAAVNWRLVFGFSALTGMAGALWSYLSLRETGTRTRERIDWPGTVVLALGLTGVLAGLSYAVQPYGGDVMGWTSPATLTCLAGGAALLAAFCLVELRVPNPMFDLSLLKIRPVAVGIAAELLGAVAGGGLQFVLIIWLEGIWLVLHGYSPDAIPVWAGIYLLPLTIGAVAAAPVAGRLADRLGAHWLASGGLLLSAAAFAGLAVLPADFAYAAFGVLIFVAGAGSIIFSTANQVTVIGSVPPTRAGDASGMINTLRYSGYLLSVAMFFALLVTGLSGTLPATLMGGGQSSLRPLTGPFDSGLTLAFALAAGVFVLAAGISVLAGSLPRARGRP